MSTAVILRHAFTTSSPAHYFVAGSSAFTPSVHVIHRPLTVTPVCFPSRRSPTIFAPPTPTPNAITPAIPIAMFHYLPELTNGFTSTLSSRHSADTKLC